MASVRKRPLFAVILRSRITFILALLAVVVLAMSVYERFAIEREMAERRRAVEAERAMLAERKEELAHKVEYLNAEHGVEAELRRHFDVAREGEQVVVIVENEVDSAGTSTELEEERRPFWARFIPWYD